MFELTDVVVALGGIGAERVLLRGARLRVDPGGTVLLSGLDDEARRAMLRLSTGALAPRYGRVTVDGAPDTGTLLLDVGDRPTGTAVSAAVGGAAGRTLVMLAGGSPADGPRIRRLRLRGGRFVAEDGPDVPVGGTGPGPAARPQVVVVPADELQDRIRDRLGDAGADGDQARTVARVLVDAERRGHRSHGVALLPTYLDRIRRGGIRLEARPQLRRTSPTVAMVDAQGGLGQVAADLAAGWCARTAAERAVASLAARHPALRTILSVSADGRPQQAVTDDLDGLLPVVEPVPDAGAARARLRRPAVAPLDVEGPQWRGLVVAYPGGAALGLLADHCIFDGESGNVVMRDLARAYAGHDLPVPRDEPTAVDRARQEAEYLASEAGARDLAFWRQELAGLADGDAPERPADRGPRAGPAARTGDAVLPRVHRLRPSPEVVASLGRLAGELGTSPFALVTCLLQAFAARELTGPDVCVSIAVSQRDTAGAPDAVGYLVNLVPLRRTVDGTVPVREDLARGVAAFHRALRHARVPFETIVAEAGPRKALAPGILTRLVCAQDVGRHTPERVGRVGFRSFEPLQLPTPYDLTVFVPERLPGTGLRLVAGAGLDAGAVDGLVRRLGRFVGGAARNHAAPSARAW